MGFWHTGYMEFHEPVGLDDCRFERSPPEFSCAHCNEIYSSIDKLRQHRFESHPLCRPILFLWGRELGAHPVRITRRPTENDVNADDCDQAFLNGQEISIRSIPRELARISSGIYRLVLRRSDVYAEFTLDFRIASEEDLQGIERQFKRMASEKHLDVHAVERFISATSDFEGAIGYCDGICSYLHGVLAREGSPDSSLAHDAYVRKFNKAAEELIAYERPLARTICSLIEFHFNHFDDAARLTDKTRVSRAAAKYARWMRGGMLELKKRPVSNVVHGDIEALVTERKTEQIVMWALRPLDNFFAQVDEIETFLKQDLGKYDGVKVHMLLGETYVKSGDTENVLRHAKALRNLPALEIWAESMILKHSRRQDELF